MARNSRNSAGGSSNRKTTGTGRRAGASPSRSFGGERPAGRRGQNVPGSRNTRPTGESSFDRPRRSDSFEGGGEGARRSFSARPSRDSRPSDRPYGSRDSRPSDRPYGSRDSRSSDRPYGSRDTRSSDRPYGSRDSRSSDRPYGSRDSRPSDRPYGSRDSRPSDRPYGSRDSRPSDRPYGSREGRSDDRRGSFRRDSDDRRSNSERREGDQKLFGRSADRPSMYDRGTPDRFSEPKHRGRPSMKDASERFAKDSDIIGRDADRPSMYERTTERFPKPKDDDKSPRRAASERFPKDTKLFGRDADRPSMYERTTERFSEQPERRPRRRREEQPEGPSRRVGAVRAPYLDDETLKAKLPPRLLRRVEEKERKEKTFDGLRLNRFISNAGVCSRREADELIASGEIKVNGKTVTEMGYRVQPKDVVKYKGKELSRQKFIYVLLNKPKDYITTTDDPDERRTVMDLVAGACRERIYPVGRLDRNTTGLLLLTNDGDLAEKLSHPSNEVRKIYQVELDKPFTDEHFEQLQKGIELEDGFIKPDDLALVTPDAEVVGIEIHSGKNRIVRRIFEHMGYDVQKLDRSVYAGLTKKELPRGKWRFLTEKEVVKLKYMS